MDVSLSLYLQVNLHVMSIHLTEKRNMDAQAKGSILFRPYVGASVEVPDARGLLTTRG